MFKIIINFILFITIATINKTHYYKAMQQINDTKVTLYPSTVINSELKVVLITQ